LEQDLSDGKDFVIPVCVVFAQYDKQTDAGALTDGGKCLLKKVGGK